MKIKGIIFDKDGTLIDFHSLWVDIAVTSIEKFVQINSIGHVDNIEKYILESIGVKNNYIDPDGALAHKASYNLALDIYEALLKVDIDIPLENVRSQMVELFNSSVTNESVRFNTFTDMKELIAKLKARNIFIGLATADTVFSATKCLERLGIIDDFDFVGGDDGRIVPKPDPDMVNRFVELNGLEPKDIAVVGDTLCDMKFAKNSGAMAIGVLSGVSKEEDFQGKADHVIESVDKLLELLDIL